MFRYCKNVFNVISVVNNPANGSIIGSVPDMAGGDVNHAIEGAYNAFQTWKMTTAKVIVQNCLIVPASQCFSVQWCIVTC